MSYTFENRYIIIDADTRVGFNYFKKQYYVTNKTYTTYRDTIALIQEVLAVLGITDITDEQLQSLADTFEELEALSYTLQDNGAYIHTIQFNGYEEYPLTIDCEKAKLYIMNTSIVYDLTVNESPRNVRVPRLRSYYKDTLGIDISFDDMLYFYELLTSYYKPTCYNQVVVDEVNHIAYYGNKLILSNYNNTSPAVYNCTYNPNDNAPNTNIGNIIATDSILSTITLNSAPTKELLQGNTIIVNGANANIEDTEYTADGTYLVQSVSGNVITVSGTIPISYTFPYKECYLQLTPYTITKMSRSTRTIQVSANPENILTGDIILVTGASVSQPHGEPPISCNGTYTVEEVIEETVSSVTSYYIVVEEEIPTDIGSIGAKLTKEYFISNIASISNKKINLTDSNSLTLTGATISVHTISNDETTIATYTVSSYTSNSITVEESIPNYNPEPDFPKLQVPIPTGDNVEVLIDVTSVTEDNEKIFPTGEFMVDNYTQCIDYLELLVGLEVPTDENKLKMYSKVGDITLGAIGSHTPEITNLKFKGLYSDVYTE